MSESASGEGPHPPGSDGIEPVVRSPSRLKSAWKRWQGARKWFARAMEPTHGPLPFDLIDILLSAVKSAILRVVRMAAVPATGTALGWWAMAFDEADSWDPRTWPTPLDLVYHDGDWDFSVLADLPVAGVLTWVISFVGCFQTPWLFPLWLATIFIQFCWCVSAAAGLETRWLAPTAIVAAAIQVYASRLDDTPGGIGIAFLAITGASLFALQWVRLWMMAHDLTPWDWFDRNRSGFDPAFHRWRRPPGGPGHSTIPDEPTPKADKPTPPATPPAES